jgi:hypothetical protein
LFFLLLFFFFFLKVEGGLPDFPDVEGPSFYWFLCGEVVQGDHGVRYELMDIPA